MPPITTNVNFATRHLNRPSRDVSLDSSKSVYCYFTNVDSRRSRIINELVLERFARYVTHEIRVGIPDGIVLKSTSRNVPRTNILATAGEWSVGSPVPVLGNSNTTRGLVIPSQLPRQRWILEGGYFYSSRTLDRWVTDEGLGIHECCDLEFHTLLDWV